MIALSAVAFPWQPDELTDFYQTIAKTPDISRVYIGEVVCRKRATLKLRQWLDIAEQLSQAGKEVVFSLPWLVNSGSDERYIEKVLGQWSGLVEANELTAVAAASQAQRSFVGGSQLAIYNQATLKWMQARGMTRWSPPVELSRQWLAGVLSAPRPEVELMAYGHQMLGISARCLQARLAGKTRQSCQQLCIGQDKQPLTTQAGEQLLLANGHVTMSAKSVNLLALKNEMPDYVDSVRISLSTPDDLARVLSDSPSLAADECNGFWYGLAGDQQVITQVKS